MLVVEAVDVAKLGVGVILAIFGQLDKSRW
jgi:hypothetical protein